MLKASIDADIFREAIEVVSALVTECRLHADANGIRTRAVDTANVAMVSLDLGKDGFSAFSATTEEVGLDITKMKNILGMMNKGDTLSLQLADSARKLELSFGSYRVLRHPPRREHGKEGPEPANHRAPGEGRHLRRGPRLGDQGRERGIR